MLAALQCTGATAAMAALPAGVTQLDRAEATLMPEGGPAREIQAQSLPHRWDSSYPRADGKAVYRMMLPAAASTVPHALFIARVGNQAEIRIDGHLIAALGTLAQLDSDFAKAPFWLDIPASILRGTEPTPMELTVTMQANRWGGLSAVLFGPAAQLRPLYVTNYRWRQIASVVIVLALAMMALMASGLWFKQRDGLYGMLALTALFGMIRMGDRLLVTPPLPWPLWGAVAGSAFIVHLMLMARFALQAVGERGRWIPLGFWVAVVAGCIAAFASFLLRQPMLWTAALACTAFPSAALLFCVVRRGVFDRSRASILLLVASLVVVSAGIRDFLMVRLPESGGGSFSILPHAVFLFVLCMGWIVVDRYSQQVIEYRKLNNSLEQRIAEREAELDRSYTKLSRQNEERATLQERQRIMRDIHDGVGAHLVSLLALIKQGGIPADALQSEINTALDELRVAVDSLQPVHGDLTTVLATLRYRLQPRFEAAGLEIAWDVDRLPELRSLTPQVVLQIQRMLLEAFTNILRHARATRVAISARASARPTVLTVEVRDNGIGFTGSEQSLGQGMKSMRHRGEAIGATLSVLSAPGDGTTVRIELAGETVAE